MAGVSAAALSAAEAPWACEGCMAINPHALDRCKVCNNWRSQEAAAEFFAEQRAAKAEVAAVAAAADEERRQQRQRIAERRAGAMLGRLRQSNVAQAFDMWVGLVQGSALYQQRHADRFEHWGFVEGKVCAVLPDHSAVATAFKEAGERERLPEEGDGRPSDWYIVTCGRSGVIVAIPPRGSSEPLFTV